MYLATTLGAGRGSTSAKKSYNQTLLKYLNFMIILNFLNFKMCYFCITVHLILFSNPKLFNFGSAVTSSCLKKQLSSKLIIKPISYNEFTIIGRGGRGHYSISFLSTASKSFDRNKCDIAGVCSITSRDKDLNVMMYLYDVLTLFNITALILSKRPFLHGGPWFHFHTCWYLQETDPCIWF